MVNLSGRPRVPLHLDLTFMLPVAFQLSRTNDGTQIESEQLRPQGLVLRFYLFKTQRLAKIGRDTEYPVEVDGIEKSGVFAKIGIVHDVDNVLKA